MYKKNRIETKFFTLYIYHQKTQEIPKSDEPKLDDKKESKVEEVKAQDKTIEIKTDDKKSEPKPDDKKSEPKPDDKTIEIKSDEKKVEQTSEDKKQTKLEPPQPKMQSISEIESTDKPIESTIPETVQEKTDTLTPKTPDTRKGSLNIDPKRRESVKVRILKSRSFLLFHSYFNSYKILNF